MSVNILAIIPARAGSKAIPNKNIRSVNGHPMIYYAINNAIQSKYISDIVVSTDSEEVKIIANQMSVKCHWRKPELCGDAVALDSVVYDAVINEDKKYDFVITMQPTSPTLKVETLDHAIEYAMDNDLDTLISAINAPHLSWRDENGKKMPNYEKRLNRQYLPANYSETGAFLISKSSVVNENSRIGKRVDIYEVSESEAVDVDNFIDLYAVGEILNQKKVAIYVNGNNLRGTGHIYRALEIADEFLIKPDIYYDLNQTDRDLFGKTTHNLIPVNGIFELFEIIKKQQYTIVINDILSTSLDYMIGLRSVMPVEGKIINFEDEGEGAGQADLVFNALYSEQNSEKIFGGEKYYIAPKLFMLYNPIELRKDVSRVFISFGGADPQNYTDRLLDIITSKEKYNKYEFIIAIGRAKNNVDALLQYNSYDNIEVLYDVRNMPDLMRKCDVSMTSRGRTAYELAMLGIPAIVLSQNKREEGHGFVCDENGFMYMGTNPSNHMIESTLDMYLSMPIEDRRNIQEQLLKADLKNGRKRVISMIQNL
ncbi:MAG: cytidylyltransferase domain-containing protein [Ruminococcus sp.]